MTVPSAITDHTEEAIEHLLSDLQDTSYVALQGLSSALVRRFQEIEDAAWRTIDLRLIDNATGKALAKLGRLVGQPKTVASDADYRILIKARAKANRSESRPLDLYTLLTVLLGDAAEFRIRELANLIYVDCLSDHSAYSFNATTVGDALRLAKRSGAAMHYIYSNKDNANTFTWGYRSDNPDNQGWAYDSSSDFSGYWSGVYRPADTLRIDQ